MRDLTHGAIGALLAYAAYRWFGHAVWSLVAVALYFPFYLKFRDRFPPPKKRESEAAPD